MCPKTVRASRKPVTLKWGGNLSHLEEKIREEYRAKQVRYLVLRKEDLRRYLYA